MNRKKCAGSHWKISKYDIKTASLKSPRFSYSGRITAFSPQFPKWNNFFRFILRPIDLHDLVVLKKKFTVTTRFTTFYHFLFHYKARVISSTMYLLSMEEYCTE